MMDVVQRLEAAMKLLERVRADSSSAALDPLAEGLRDAVDECLRLDAEYARLEAVDDQAAVQRELLQTLGCPILRVHRDVLCAPLVGPFDRERSAQLRETVLHEVARTQARLVVFDVTGAVIPEASDAEHLVLTCRALRLLGTAAALSGVSPQLAQMLVAHDALRLDVPTYLSLEAALSSIHRR